MKDEGRILSANSLRPSSFVPRLVLKNLIPIQLNQCPQQSIWSNNIFSLSEVSLSGVFATMQRWLTSGGPLGWGLML